MLLCYSRHSFIEVAMKHNFPIQEFTRQVRIPVDELSYISLDEDFPKGYILTMARKFALGDQLTTTESHTEGNEKFIEMPSTLIDYLKHALVQWEPTLNFGWLSPSYMSIMVNCINNYSTSNYYNVYPVSTEKRINSLELLETPLTPVTWLKGVPATNEDIKQQQVYLQRGECAKAIAFTKEFR